MPWHNARKKRSATQRQARFAGGMSCVLHNMQRSSPTQSSLPKSKRPSRNANLESKREFAPYFKRSAEMGGSKRAVTPSLWHGGSKKTQWFTMAGAVCGGRRRRLRGACSTFCTTCNEASLCRTHCIFESSECGRRTKKAGFLFLEKEPRFSCRSNQCAVRIRAGRKARATSCRRWGERRGRRWSKR